MKNLEFLSAPLLLIYTLLLVSITVNLLALSGFTFTSTGGNCSTNCPADASCNNNKRSIDHLAGNIYQIPNGLLIAGIRTDSDKIYATALRNAFRCSTGTCPVGVPSVYQVTLNRLDTAYFISKVVLDDIFNSNITAPGINCRLRYDDTKKRFFLSVKAQTESVSKCQPTANGVFTHVYADRIYCPTQCNE